MVNKTPEKRESSFKMLFRRTWFYYAGFAVLLLLIFGQFFFSDMMFYSSDQLGGLDAKYFLKDSILKFKQFPMWFNSRLSGMPSIDAIFGDAIYPPSMVMHILFSIPRSIGMKMVFHIFLAGVFFFLLMRKGFGCSRILSFICGTFYMLNPQFVSLIYGGHDGKMYVIALLPFVVWRLKALMEIPGIRNASFLGLGVGLMLLTSHIQMTYFVLWGLFFYWLISMVVVLVQKKNKGAAVSLALYFWLGIFIGLGIGLIQLLPSYMYVRNAFSVRGVDRGFDHAVSWSMHWPEIFSLWVPEFVNYLDYYWGQNPFKLNTEYAGAIVLLLGVLAVIRKPGINRYFWAGFTIFVLLYSLGAHSFIFKLAYYIVPGVSKFRAASMITFWFSFGVVLLAGLFLKDVAEGKLSRMNEGSQKKWIKGILLAVGSCFLVTLLFSNKGFVQGMFASALIDQNRQAVFDINFSEQFVPYLWLWMFFVISTLLLLYGVIKGKVSASIFIAAVFLFGLVDVLRIDIGKKPSLQSRGEKIGFIQLIDPARLIRQEEVLNKLSNEMKAAPFRCFSLPGAMSVRNGEGIYGLEGIGGFHDNELRWYRDFRGDQQDRNFFSSLIGFSGDGQAYLKTEELQKGNPYLNLANVQYYLVRSQGKLMAVRNEHALGRISFASRFVVMDSSQILNALNNGSYDYRNTVALTATPEVQQVNDDSIQGNMLVSWKKYSPNYRKAKVLVPGNGFLRISEIYYPGWEIRIDGKKTDYYRADYCWIAVPVTGGKHVVELIPHSMFIGKAAAVSVGILILLSVYWLFLIVHGKKRKISSINKSSNVSTPEKSGVLIEY